jgi:TRAP-type C4-dicarboxylate transport system substrate-binding protein
MPSSRRRRSRRWTVSRARCSSRASFKAGDEIESAAREATKAQKGQTVAALSPDEEKRWQAKLQPITDTWIKETPDGAKVLAAFRQEIAAIRAGK